MGFLAGKRLLITGVLSNRSIAYGIARACRREGAELAFSYVRRALQGPRHRVRRRVRLGAASSTATSPTTPRSQALFADARRKPGRQFDGFVHSIGFAPKEAIAGDFLDGLSRESFRIAHDISAYSFPAMAKAAAPRLRARRRAADADLPRRAAQRAQLQHDGPGQGVARGQRALPGGQPRAEGRARQRHLGRADQDAGRLRASRASARCSTSSPRTRRWAAT